MRLTVDKISFTYLKKMVLQQAELNISKNELVAVLGPNGVGKTTFLKCINNILSPGEGTVFINNENIAKMTLKEIAAKVSYVSQKECASRITVYDAILLGRKPYIKFNTLSEKDHRIVAGIIDRLELNDLSLRYTDELSGGELQKVCIARALVQEPDVILLDEPVSFLDLRNQLEIMELVREIVDNHDIIAVMTVHDVNLAIRYAHRLAFVKDGKVCRDIYPSEITSDIIRQVYGIDCEIIKINGNAFVYPLNIAERE